MGAGSSSIRTAGGKHAFIPSCPIWGLRFRLHVARYNFPPSFVLWQLGLE